MLRYNSLSKAHVLSCTQARFEPRPYIRKLWPHWKLHISSLATWTNKLSGVVKCKAPDSTIKKCLTVILNWKYYELLTILLAQGLHTQFHHFWVDVFTPFISDIEGERHHSTAVTSVDSPPLSCRPTLWCSCVVPGLELGFPWWSILSTTELSPNPWTWFLIVANI